MPFSVLPGLRCLKQRGSRLSMMHGSASEAAVKTVGGHALFNLKSLRNVFGEELCRIRIQSAQFSIVKI